MIRTGTGWIPITILCMYLLLLGVLCSGCAGLGDYEYDVAGGYKVNKSNPHGIIVMRQKGGYSEGNYIPPKVVEVAWDNRFVIAKQLGFKTKIVDGKKYGGELDENDVNYWILDTAIEKAYGPYNLEEFEKNRPLLGVSPDIILKRVSSYPQKPVEGEWIVTMILLIPLLIVLGPIIILFWLIGRAIVTAVRKIIRDWNRP